MVKLDILPCQVLAEVRFLVKAAQVDYLSVH